MSKAFSEALSDTLAACVAAAREQGWDGEDGEYEYTAVDLEYVIHSVGRKPSRQEWADAGLPYAGGAHYDD